MCILNLSFFPQAEDQCETLKVELLNANSMLSDTQEEKARLEIEASQVRREKRVIIYKLIGPWEILLKLIISHSSLGTHCEIALRWMPQGLTNEKSTLVQVMAPDGTKPLPEPMLTQIYVNIWHD